MSYIEFYKLENNGDQNVIATCVLGEDGIVLCNGDEAIVDNLETKGIKNFSGSESTRLFPKDGKVFLEQLQNNFDSEYLNVSDIKE